MIGPGVDVPIKMTMMNIPLTDADNPNEGRETWAFKIQVGRQPQIGWFLYKDQQPIFAKQAFLMVAEQMYEEFEKFYLGTEEEHGSS